MELGCVADSTAETVGFDDKFVWPLDGPWNDRGEITEASTG